MLFYRDDADHLEETQAEVNKNEKLEKIKKGSGTADRTKIAKLKSRNQGLRQKHRNKSHNIGKNISPKGLSKFRQFGKFKTISNERLAAYGLGLKRKKIRK